MTSNNNVIYNTSTPFFISGLTSLVVRHNTLTAAAGDGGDIDPTLSSSGDGDNLSPINPRRLEFPELDPARSVAIAFPLILIVLCTVCGNLLVLLAVITTRKLRTATNYFIVNLAIADLMLGLTVLPFSTTIEILDGFWIFGQALCDMWVTVDVLCCTASIYGLCVISVDRYIGVSKPLVHHQIVNKHRAVLINLGVWLLSACICVVPFFGWRKSLSVEAGRCEVNEDRAYVIFSATCSFFLPCTIVIIVYWRIYLKAVQQTRFMKLGYKEAKMTSKTGENGIVLRIHTGAVQSMSNSLAPPTTTQQAGGAGGGGGPLQLRPSISKRDSAISTDFATAIDTNLRQRKIDWTKFKRERRAARTLGIVVGVFIACWVPFFVILPTNAFCECLPPQLFKVVFWLGYCNSLMNPFIYGADSREFQMAFKRLLCGKKGSSYSSQTSGTPRCASSILAKTRRQILANNKNRGQGGGSGAYNNGSASTYMRPSALPTPQEEDNESLASADGLSTTVVMKSARSNTSLNRMMLNIGSNGLLTVPQSGASAQPLLAEFNEQNCSVETTLVDASGHATVTISRPSDGDIVIPPDAQSSPIRTLAVASRGVSTSTGSLKAINKSQTPSPAPMAESESEHEAGTIAAGTVISARSPSSLKNKTPQNSKINEQTATGEQTPQRSPIQPIRDRVMSTSSLSTLSSPSDSDDEELKRRKRASREHRPKKHFRRYALAGIRRLYTSSTTSNQSAPASTSSTTNARFGSGFRRLSALLLNRRRRYQKRTGSTGGYLMNQHLRKLSVLSNNSAGEPVPSTVLVTSPGETAEHGSFVQSDDLASLAFRRLLMVRFARRVRAKSKAARETLGGENSNGADFYDTQNQQTPTAGGGEFFPPSNYSPSSGRPTGLTMFPAKPIQTLAPQSRWRTALSKITSTPPTALPPPSVLVTSSGGVKNLSSCSVKISQTMSAEVAKQQRKLSTSNTSIIGKPAAAITCATSTVIAVAVQSSSQSINSLGINNNNNNDLPANKSPSTTNKISTTKSPFSSINKGDDFIPQIEETGRLNSVSTANSSSVFFTTSNNSPVNTPAAESSGNLAIITGSPPDRCILELEENGVEL